MAPTSGSVCVGRLRFEVTSLELARAQILNMSRERSPVNVRLANAYNVALAERDPAYAKLMAEGANLPDGSPVVWAMRLRINGRSARRVRGPSLFREVLTASSGSDARHFLLGGTPETLELLESRISQEYPQALIAGSYSPPFADITDEYIEDCASAIRLSKANLVWVGLGTPKQDYVGTALAKVLQLTTVNVGAAFAFEAGTVRNAPTWIQNSGFEWLYRLAQEPRRLWRRYLLGNWVFILSVIRGFLAR